jgi:hypothetical protein
MTHRRREPAGQESMYGSRCCAQGVERSHQTSTHRGPASAFAGFTVRSHIPSLISVTELFVQSLIVSHLPARVRSDVIQNCITLYFSNVFVFETPKGD